MTELEKTRLNDFKMVLRYHLCAKIKHFRCTPKEFYSACRLYDEFKKNHKYNKRIFELLAAVNASGLSAKQVQSIFGYATGHKWIAWKKIVEDDPDLTVRKHGTQYCKKVGTRRHFTNCYFLPLAQIEQVFADEEMLNKVLDAESDIYTPRQRCMIFSQINGRKGSRYKTNKQIMQDRADNLSDEELEALINDMDLKGN